MNDKNTTTESVVESSTALATMPDSGIEKVGDNLDLTAATPTQLAECQVSMIDWVKAKIERVTMEVAEAEGEAKELHDSYDYAEKQKWKKDTLHSHWKKAEKRVGFHKERVEYYQKILSALEAGFYIVPPMDIKLFAI